MSTKNKLVDFRAVREAVSMERNLERARQEPAETPLIVVEGFFDVMTLRQHGHRKVVALMGSSISTAKLDLMRRFFAPDTRILVMLDEDDAGRAARDEVAARLARHARVRRSLAKASSPRFTNWATGLRDVEPPQHGRLPNSLDRAHRP